MLIIDVYVPLELFLIKTLTVYLVIIHVGHVLVHKEVNVLIVSFHSFWMKLLRHVIVSKAPTLLERLVNHFVEMVLRNRAKDVMMEIY